MKFTLFTALSLLSVVGLSQRTFDFEDYITPEVTVNGSTLLNGLAGGLNIPQFANIDLDLDGNQDLVIFERDGNVLLPFLNTGSPSNTQFEYAPEYKKHFPSNLQHIVKLVDYNCDGKADIFCKVLNGIGVYENTSVDSLSFSWALGTDSYLYTSFANGQVSNIYVLQIDMPVISDVDGDGDVDILGFDVNGVQVYFYENISSNNCGLDYYLSQECWGGFREDPNNNGVELDACITGKAPPMDPEGVIHAGSTLLSLDMNGDGLQELITGDISFSEATLLTNTGVSDSAYMSAQTSNWAPDGNVMVDLYVFPAFYYVDVTGDGVSDLVASPNIMPSKNLNQVWMYQNNGTQNVPNFSFTDSSFIQNTMIDMGEGAYPTFVDINSDGQMDIIVGNRGVWESGGNYSSAVWYLKNTSTANDISFEVVSKNFIPFSGIANPLNPVPAFGDLDGDGDQDLIVGFEDGTLAYYENTGTAINPSFPSAVANYQGIDIGQFAAPELFDINGDGQLDLLVGEKDGNLNYYQNSNGTFTLVTDNFGGVSVDKYGSLSAYSVPRMYDNLGKEQLYVGSEEMGILQFDSASSIVSQPSIIESTIGTGTSSTSTSEETPFGALKRTGRNQLLFTAAELTALGYGYGQIEKIAFDVTTNNTSNSITNGITVRMKNTMSTSLNAFETGLDDVYNNSMPITPGWNEINLQTPFVWDGTSNLVIEICFSRNLPLNDNPVAVTDVGFAANAYGDYTGYNNNTSNGCNMPYLASSNMRPNMKMSIRPIVIPTGELASGYRRMNADFADLDFDGIPEAIVGNYAGGMVLYKGKAHVVSILEQPEKLEAGIYPNPTNGLVRIDIENPEGTQYQILDLNGRVYERGTLLSNAELNLSGWANGIYILQLVQDGQASYAKIIKQ